MRAHGFQVEAVPGPKLLVRLSDADVNFEPARLSHGPLKPSPVARITEAEAGAFGGQLDHIGLPPGQAAEAGRRNGRACPRRLQLQPGAGCITDVLDVGVNHTSGRVLMYLLRPG